MVRFGNVKLFPGEQSNTAGAKLGRDAETVVLDFADPAEPSRRLFDNEGQTKRRTWRFNLRDTDVPNNWDRQAGESSLCGESGFGLD